MPKHRSRLERFLKTHHGFLTYAGAFIVFLTFIVKEGLGEHWSRTADAIDLAQYIHGIHVEISPDIVPEMISQAAEGSEKKDAFIRVSRHLEGAKAKLSMTELKLANLDILVDKLPSCDANRKKALELSCDLKSVDSRVANLGEALSSAVSDALKKDLHSQTMDYLDAIAFNLQDQDQDILKTVTTMHKRFNSLVPTILADAQEIRAHNSTRSIYAWWISTVLFAVGWGLGLLGKVYGVPGGAGAE